MVAELKRSRGPIECVRASKSSGSSLSECRDMHKIPYTPMSPRLIYLYYDIVKCLENHYKNSLCINNRMVISG